MNRALFDPIAKAFVVMDEKGTILACAANKQVCYVNKSSQVVNLGEALPFPDLSTLTETQINTFLMELSDDYEKWQSKNSNGVLDDTIGHSSQ